MNFLEKVKKGVTEAGNKAKQTVEINRLKMQINSKEKEIDDIYIKMGKLAFDKYVSPLNDDKGEIFETHCKDVIQLNSEINELELKIKELTNIKVCDRCEKEVSIEVKFCPSCGNSFFTEQKPVNKEASQQEKQEVKTCEKCHKPLEPNASFCAECGTKQSEMGFVE